MNQNFAITLDAARGVQMSCRDFGCQNWRNGWAVVLDPSNEDHARKYRAIKNDLTRRHIALQSETAAEWVMNHGAAQGITDSEGTLATLLSSTPAGVVVLLFPPGQTCFAKHMDREVTFAHKERGIVRVHERFADYREHWDEEAYRVNELMRRG